MPTTWRALTGAGYWQLRIEPSGAWTLIGARLPVLLGSSGLRQDADREGRIGVGVVEHDVDAARGLRRRAGEIDQDLARIGIDGHGRFQRDDLSAGHIERAFATERAGLELGNRCAGRRLRARDDLVGQFLDVDETIALAHRDQPLACRLPARHLRGEIAEHGVGRPHVRLDHGVQHRARLASVVELQRRNPEAFFMHVAGAGADAVAADVGVMNGRADIGEDAVAVEDRRQHRDVEEMPGREPGIVGGDARRPA